MTMASKEKTEIHFKALFQELSRLETDCKILRGWAEDRGLSSAKTLSMLIADSLEELGSHLSDFKELLVEEGRVSSKKSVRYSEGAD